MYLLSHLVLVNWHNFEPLELPFSRLTAVIGENRSGKSTLLDAIQVAMLGNHGSWRELNRAAGDERSRRTVRSYCLGMVAPEQPPLRDSAVTWIALHFKDEETGHDVTFGVNLVASLGDPAERSSPFVVKGLALGLADFVAEAEEDGARFLLPRDWENASARIARRVAAQPGGAFLAPTGPERFIGEWMKALNAGGRSPQPSVFAKPFVKTVAYRQVSSDDQFVKQFLLPEKPIGIAQLRTAIATYREVDRHIKLIRIEIGLLQEAAREAERHFEALAGWFAEGWTMNRAEVQQAWRLLRRNRKRIAEKRAEATLAAEELERGDAELREAEAAQQDIQAKIAQSAAGQLQSIGLQEKDAGREREDAQRELELWRQDCAAAVLAARSGLLDGTARLGSLAERLAGLEALAGPEALAGADPADFPRAPGALRRAIDEIAAAQESTAAAAHLEREARRAAAAMEQAQQGYDQGREMLQRLRGGQAPIGGETAAFMQALQDEGLAPQVLCALVSVTDEGWRDAAEALLGAEREAIILPPAQVEPAIRFWRRQGERFRRCRVARTDKVTAPQGAPGAGSMAAIVVAEDPLVAGYLRRRIGEVRLADTVEALRAPGRAIMRDCYYDDGLSVRRLGFRGPPLLGREVGAAAERHLAAEMARLQAEVQHASAEIRQRQAAADTLRRLLEAGAGGRRPVDQLDEARGLAEARLEALAAQRRKIEGSIAPDWQAEAAALAARIAALRQEQKEALTAKLKAENDAAVAQAELDRGEDYPGSLLCYRFRLQQLKQAERNIPAGAGLRLPGRAQMRRQFRERLSRLHDEPKVLAHEAQQRRGQRQSVAEAARDAFWSRVDEYRRRIATPQAEELQSGRMSVAEADERIRARIGYLEGHSLLEFESQMERAAREMSKVFQTEFVAAVRDRMEIVRQEIDRINAILRPRSFHQERYRFRHRVAAEYEGVIQLAERAAEDPDGLMSLFGDRMQEGDRLTPAVESVKRLLLSEEVDAAGFEDYRNYWVFWLESAQVDTDRWVSFQARKGTGSGAESQTPFYIAMGAALAAAYRGARAPRSGGAGLALFDEAFSKMDPNNQRRMLDFFAAIGLQPVVAAPLSGQTALVSRMDRIHEVWRSGDRAQVESYAPGPELRAAVEREDPSTLTREQLLAIAERTAEPPSASDERSRAAE